MRFEPAAVSMSALIGSSNVDHASDKAIRFIANSQGTLYEEAVWINFGFVANDGNRVRAAPLGPASGLGRRLANDRSYYFRCRYGRNEKRTCRRRWRAR